MWVREKRFSTIYNKLWSKVFGLRKTYFPVSFQLVLYIFYSNQTCKRFSLALSQYWLTRIHTSIHPCLKTVWQQTFDAQWPVVPGFIRCTFHFFTFHSFFFIFFFTKSASIFVVCSLQPHIKFLFDRQRLIIHIWNALIFTIRSLAICFNCGTVEMTGSLVSRFNIISFRLTNPIIFYDFYNHWHEEIECLTIVTFVTPIEFSTKISTLSIQCNAYDHRRTTKN